MKKILFLSVFTMLILTSCKKSKSENTTTTTTTKEIVCPDCLDTQIEAMLQSPKQDPRGTIKAYIYQNDTVFAVNSNYADSETSVYNERCEFICFDGGIGGNGSGTCVNWNNATYLETVWIDPR